jgi:hypothetical protein
MRQENNAEIERKRQILQMEINKNKVNIDKTVFVKSEHEKELLKVEKKVYKEYVKRGDFKIRETIIEKIVSCKNPKFNISVII